MQRTIFLILLSVVFSLLSCDKNTGDSNNRKAEDNKPAEKDKTPAVLNFGTQTGSVYENDYFGLKVTLPEDWYVQSREMNAEIEQAQNAVKQPIEALQTIYLLYAFMHEPGSVVEYNAGMNIVASNLSQNTEGGTADDYLNELIKNLSTIPGYRFSDKNITDMKIGGLNMRAAKGQTTIEGIDISQLYLVTLRKGYAIQITLSWSNEVQRNQLTDVLKKTEFFM
ncbi:MAG: hypothetical protein SF052_05970 [Bacteroidia bacterium]|nr:hypothetical protein [Bacteroidia bacterium]